MQNGSHDLLVPQSTCLLSGEPREPAEQLLRVLAEGGRRPSDRSPGRGHLDGEARQPRDAGHRVGHFQDPFAGLDLGVRKDPVHGVDGGAGNVGPAEQGKGFLPAWTGQRPSDALLERPFVSVAPGIFGKTFVLQDLRNVQGGAEPFEQLRIPGSHDDAVLLGGKGIEGRAGGMAVADGPGGALSA